MNKLKRFMMLSLGVAAVLATAAFSVPSLVTTVGVRIVGPYFTSPVAFDSTSANQVGGRVQYYLAADSCRIGQVVYMSSKNNVKPSATVADYNAVVGVVVGGTRTSMQASIALADTSTLAATIGQRVIVLKQGRTWVLNSAAGIGPGIQVIPTTTAGRMGARTTAIDSLRRIFGKMVDTAVSGKAALVDINVP